MGASSQMFILVICSFSRLSFSELLGTETAWKWIANCSAPEVAPPVTFDDISEEDVQQYHLRCPPFYASDGGSIITCRYSNDTRSSEWTPDPLQFSCESPCNVTDLPDGLIVTPDDPVIWSGVDIYFSCTEGILPETAPRKTSCMNGTWTEPIPSCNLDHGRIRLKHGRVMVTYGEVEGSICFTDEWDIHNANVVCRQLGLRPYALSVRKVPFGSSNDLIHFDSVRCQGYEEKLIDCGLSFSACDTRYYAGVECLEGDESARNGAVRLIDAGVGGFPRVELHLDGVWGGICPVVCNDDLDHSCTGGWSLERTHWFCQQLGYPGASEYALVGGDDQSENPLIYLKCPEPDWDGSSASSVPLVDIDSCTHYFLAEDVPCRYGALHATCEKAGKFSLRLTNGSTEDEGRLEIYDGEHWRTVPPFRDTVTPALICKELTGSGNYIQGVDGAFGNGLVMPKYTYSCNGDADSLSQCGVVEVDDDFINDGPVILQCGQATTTPEVVTWNPKVICWTAFAVSLAILLVAIAIRLHFHKKRTTYHRMNSYKFQKYNAGNSREDMGDDDNEVEADVGEEDGEKRDVVFDDV